MAGLLSAIFTVSGASALIRITSRRDTASTDLPRHSTRNTTTGSTRAARREGTHAAKAPTTARTTIAAARLTGSNALTP